jgi:hypothetical protein
MGNAIYFGAPPALGAVLGAAFARGMLRTYALFALGLLLGFGVLVLAYLASPPDYQHSGHTEGRQFLGRWWDPDFVLILTGIAYVLYLVGIGLGAFTREVIWLFRTDSLKSTDDGSE